MSNNYQHLSDLQNMPIGGELDANRVGVGGGANPIDIILSERQKTHGDFASCAYLAQTLKSYMVDSVHGSTLSNSQSLALEMIALKIARILNGNPNHIDDWADIAGYATLMVRELENVKSQ